MIPEQRLMVRVILQHIEDYYSYQKKIVHYKNINSIITDRLNTIKAHYKKHGKVKNARKLRMLLNDKKNRKKRLKIYRTEKTISRKWVTHRTGSFALCATAWKKSPDILADMLLKKMNNIDKGEELKVTPKKIYHLMSHRDAM